MIANINIMTRYKLKHGGRPKAIFGSQEAATLAAAGINAAASAAAAAVGAKATNDAAKQQVAAAKQQAAATTQAATKQATAIKNQADKAKELQQISLDFTKEQNAESREIQKEMQMNLQMLMGQQNANDRLEAAKIQVKNGGSIRQKLRNITPNSQGFTVTDGGGVIPIGVTPEGFPIYELYGNDHEHYHKTRGGKYKSGVGIQFENGGVIEGEGNQNSNQGELMVVTPDDAMFISKHSIRGFNPAKAVNQGMHPVQAFQIQEQIKDNHNISDDGKSKGKHRRTLRRFMGGMTGFNDPANLSQNKPNMASDISIPASLAVGYETRQRLACGGRPKASFGSWLKGAWNTTKNGISNFISDYGGATINALGNIGGAWITTNANNKAAGIISAANTQAAGILGAAYDNLTGIDINSIKRGDYAPAHAMATIQAPIVNTSTQRAAANRSLQRRINNSTRYSLSGAAAQDRISRAETDYLDTVNTIENEADKIRQSIKQGNAERITQVDTGNADREVQATRDYTSTYLQALQYNNDINNQKILGKAGVVSDAMTNNASVYANASQAIGQAWGNAISASNQGFSSAFDGIRKTNADRNNLLIGADTNNQVNYLLQTPTARGNRRRAKNLYNAWKGSSNTELANYAAQLAKIYKF